MAATDVGDFRIVKTDASETIREVLYESASELLNISTDPRQKPIVGMSKAGLREDDILKLEYKSTAATSIDFGLSTVQIPIRKKNVRTGMVSESFLRHSDFVSADVTIAAGSVGKWVEIGSYSVLAQEQIKIGLSIAENSRIYVNLVESA